MASGGAGATVLLWPSPEPNDFTGCMDGHTKKGERIPREHSVIRGRALTGIQYGVTHGMASLDQERPRMKAPETPEYELSETNRETPAPLAPSSICVEGTE